MLIPHFRWHHTTDTHFVFKQTSCSTYKISSIQWNVSGGSYTTDYKGMLYIASSLITTEVDIELTVENSNGEVATIQAKLREFGLEKILIMPYYEVRYAGKRLTIPEYSVNDSIVIRQGVWKEKVVRANTSDINATFDTTFNSFTFEYQDMPIILQSSYVLQQDLSYRVGVNSDTATLETTISVDTTWYNVTCLICKYIGLLYERMLLSDYAIDDCEDKIDIIKQLFRYQYLMLFSCNITSKTINEIQCFLKKECNKITLNCINC